MRDNVTKFRSHGEEGGGFLVLQFALHLTNDLLISRRGRAGLETGEMDG